MKLSLLSSVFVAGCAIVGSAATPVAASTVAVTSSAVSKPSLSPSTALSLINDLGPKLDTSEKQINSSLAGVTSTSSQTDKNAALARISPLLQKMTADISNITSVISQKVDDSQTSAVVKRDEISDLANSVAVILFGAVLSVDNLIEVLGLEPLALNLTPLSTALGELVSTLEPAVEGLLPELTPLLQPILTGLSEDLKLLFTQVGVSG